MPKAQMEGWVDAWNDKPIKRLPTKCPKCGAKLSKTDASRLIGIIFVWCESKGHRLTEPCRWCEIYQA